MPPADIEEIVGQPKDDHGLERKDRREIGSELRSLSVLGERNKYPI